MHCGKQLCPQISCGIVYPASLSYDLLARNQTIALNPRWALIEEYRVYMNIVDPATATNVTRTIVRKRHLDHRRSPPDVFERLIEETCLERLLAEQPMQSANRVFRTLQLEARTDSPLHQATIKVPYAVRRRQVSDWFWATLWQ